MLPRFAVLMLLGVGVLAQAQELFEGFEDPVLQQRYQHMIHEVRCLTCLNRSIADSTTPLAHDLRREIRERMAAGQTDAEIKGFLTSRYGDFVLYRPPFKPSNWAVWAAPGVLLLVGAIIFAWVLKSRLHQPIVEDDDEALEA